MEVTVKCNSCDERVAVQDGANQLVCPHCNTWQMIEPGAESVPDIFDDPMEDPFPISEPDVAEGSSAFDAVLEDDPTGSPLEADMNEVVTQPNRSSEPMPTGPLAFLETETGERLEVRVGVNAVGRSDADLLIYDQSVSRKHCYIEINTSPSGVKAEIYDVGHKGGTPSTNGVYLSGRTQRLETYERIALRDGMYITLGRVRLLFRMPNNLQRK